VAHLAGVVALYTADERHLPAGHQRARRH
jgi:hypothetical protein